LASSELDDIEGFVRERGLSAQFIKIAEAKEYRETLAMREQERKQRTSTRAAGDERFPQTLFSAAVSKDNAG
jgi:hypothetical protein